MYIKEDKLQTCAGEYSIYSLSVSDAYNNLNHFIETAFGVVMVPPGYKEFVMDEVKVLCLNKIAHEPVVTAVTVPGPDNHNMLIKETASSSEWVRFAMKALAYFKWRPFHEVVVIHPMPDEEGDKILLEMHTGMTFLYTYGNQILSAYNHFMNAIVKEMGIT